MRVCGCLPVCVFTSRHRSTFLAPLFCFGTAKPQRTHHVHDPCLELTDPGVEEFMDPPHRITVKVSNGHEALKTPTSLPPQTLSHLILIDVSIPFAAAAPYVPREGL